MNDQQLSPPLRVGLVGAGKMGSHHLRAIANATPAAQVVAVADPAHVPTADGAGEGIGPRHYTSLSELLSHEAVDVVHIVTPPSTHASLAMTALEHDAHVYIEKPFAESLPESCQVLDFAAARSLLVCAGHQLLFEQPSLKLRPLLPALGRLVHVESYFAFRTVRRAPGGRAPLRADHQLLDILPHPVYLLLASMQDGTSAKPVLEGLRVDPRGTVHALVRKGPLTGTLLVTLDGRPVDSYLRVVGENGTVTADYVRGTIQQHIGPGISGIDKLIVPYRHARQLLFGTTAAITRRVLGSRRSYPGLAEIFGAFYGAIRNGGTSPTPPEDIRETVWLCDEVAQALLVHSVSKVPSPPRIPFQDGVLVTGGTGFLGQEVVKALLASERHVRVISRRAPAPWETVERVDYHLGDLAEQLDPEVMTGISAVIHCAAETAGGWDDHEKNSVRATENLIRQAAAAKVSRFIHVSSVAVLAGARGAIRDDTPLKQEPRRAGPYVWGKLLSEQRAIALGGELGIDVKVVRPGPLVDYKRFEAPGRLGKRIGNIFVAVGSPRQPLAILDVALAGQILAWGIGHWDSFPSAMNLLNPDTPKRRDLLRRLRETNPYLTVVWLPTMILYPLAWGGILAQKILRPTHPALNVASAFASRQYDKARTAGVVAQMEQAQRR